ncbi:MAG: hypothetical protein ACP5XB_31625 [Isosphaeraceae bacterium]
MAILTIEGRVEQGRIQLPVGVVLPEYARVYVVVPEVETTSEARIYSPRLKHPRQAADFKKEVFEASENA